MAWSTPLLELPFRTSANVSAMTTINGQWASGGIIQYTAVRNDTTTTYGDIIGSTAATIPSLGISQSSSLPGSAIGAVGPNESAIVRIHGISKLIAGAGLNPGSLLMSDSSGRGIVATTAKFALGLCLGAATDAGDVVEILCLPASYQP
jgi:hypothetical protein